MGYLCAEVVWVRVEIHNARWKREWRLTNILLKPAVICSCLCYGELSDDASNAAGEGGSIYISCCVVPVLLYHLCLISGQLLRGRSAFSGGNMKEAVSILKTFKDNVDVPQRTEVCSFRMYVQIRKFRHRFCRDYSCFRWRSSDWGDLQMLQRL